MSLAARFAAVNEGAFAALARKYETIAVLRRRRAAGGGVAPRGELLALAREFPGALRELDTLPLEEIERRRAALVGAESGRAEPWMAWLVAYHAMMRAALYAKARLTRDRVARARRPVPTAVDSAAFFRAIAEDTARQTGLPIDEDFVRSVASPPARRLNAAVFAALGAAFDVPADTIWQTLFPTHRAKRF